MPHDPLLAEIRQQIERDEIKSALKLLKKLLRGSPKLDEVLQQSARHKSLSREIRLGTVERSDARQDANQIRWALLELLTEIEEQAQQPAISEEIQTFAHKIEIKNQVKKSKLKAKGNIIIGDNNKIDDR